MSYQNVGTPRFYVNVLEWQDLVGHTTGLDKTYRTLPVTPTAWAGTNAPNNIGVSLTDGFSNRQRGFIAILGHTMQTDSSGFIISTLDNASSLYSGTSNPNVNNGDPISINFGGDSTAPDYDGFTIASIVDDLSSFGSVYLNVTQHTTIGSIIIGDYYDIQAPNLSLTMSREYGGINEFTTYNGSSMSNTMWNKPPKWGNLGAWELGDGTSTQQELSRSARRSWDLKFSYMDDSALWGSNQSLSFLANTVSGYEGQGVVDPDGDIHTITESDGSLTDGDFNYNLLTDDNFFSQVWHKTLGGTLPFIFQPDNSNNNPDQFAICRFKNNTLKATQSALNVYDISLSIEEVW